MTKETVSVFPERPSNEFVTLRDKDGYVLNTRGENVGETVDLQESITERGQVEPVVGVITSEGKIGIVAGHRRVAACRALGIWVKYRVIGHYDQFTDDELRVLMSTANLRKDPPVVLCDEDGNVTGGEADMVYMTLQSKQWNQTKLAASIGRPYQHVVALARLGDPQNPPHGRAVKAVANGTMGLMVFHRISHLTNDEQGLVMDMVASFSASAIKQAVKHLSTEGYDAIIERKRLSAENYQDLQRGGTPKEVEQFETDDEPVMVADVAETLQEIGALIRELKFKGEWKPLHINQLSGHIEMMTRLRNELIGAKPH